MSGQDNSAQKAAQKAEDERNAQIAQSSAAINGIFNSPERQAQYSDFYDATRTLGLQDLDKQKTVADRNAKFAMARSGLTGGSASIDLGKKLGQDYIDGLLKVDQSALGAKSDLIAADQVSKNNLLALAQSGADTTTVNTDALLSLQNNLDAANSTRLVGGLGTLFGDIADVNKASQTAAEQRRALYDYGRTPYVPFYGIGGSTGW